MVKEFIGSKYIVILFGLFFFFLGGGGTYNYFIFLLDAVFCSFVFTGYLFWFIKILAFLA